jgi:hypothetical protein
VRACADAARVCAQAPRACSRKNPKGHGRDANATSQPRRVVAAHGKVVVGSWRGTARPGRGGGVAMARLSGGAGVHALTGPGFPGPRCGRAVRGASASRARGTAQWHREQRRRREERAARQAPATRAARWPDGERGPMAGYGGIIGGPWLTPAAEGIEEGWLRRSPVGAEGDRARGSREVMPW